MYELRKTSQFKKDVKRCHKRGYDILMLQKALELLENTGTLPVSDYDTHPLAGYIKKMVIYDAHLKPDWILLFYVVEKERIVVLVRTGTHSDLF